MAGAYVYFEMDNPSLVALFRAAIKKKEERKKAMTWFSYNKTISRSNINGVLNVIVLLN